jgi:thiol-disulfide isomerase/thioredoxin
VYYTIVKEHLLILFSFIAIFAQGQTAGSINQHQEDSMINAHKNLLVDKPLPAFMAAGDDGVVDNGGLIGKVVYINMWEASCAPCMAEMSTLNTLYDTLLNNENFQFVSLSSDPPETIRKIKEKYHIRFSIYHLDEEGCYQLNQGVGYPTNIVLDKNNYVKYIHWGGYTDSVKIWDFIFTDEIYPFIMKELTLTQSGK